MTEWKANDTVVLALVICIVLLINADWIVK